MRWGLWWVVIGLVVFFGLLIGTSLIFAIPSVRAAALSQVELVNFGLSVLAYGGLLTVIVIASRRRGLGNLAADFGLRFRPVDIAIGLGIGLGGRLFTGALTGVTIGITGYTPPRGNFELSSGPLWIALNSVLIAAIVAPFVEELFFRGLLLRSVRNGVLRGKGRPQPAGPAVQRRAVILSILVSGVGFMLLHLYQADNLTFAIILGGSTLVVGLANARVATRTGRLGGAIIAHVVFNGSAVLLAIVLEMAVV